MSGDGAPRSPVRRSWIESDRLLVRVVAQPISRFLRIEAAGGVLLLVATVAALVWANSPWRHSYETFWHTTFTLSVGSWTFSESLVHLVNDGLMAIFFFVIGLEIKREWVAGELRDRRAAVLPAVGALGGMVVPALIYVLVTWGTGAGHGWGIPMATDIAFALGVVALLGRRVPNGLKVFLLTLAIVDDIGAILVIAVFYSEQIHPVFLLEAAAVVAAVVLLRAARVRWMLVYIVLGVVLWYVTYRSGVHATIAGVVMGLLTPAKPFQPPEATEAAIDLLEDRDDLNAEDLRELRWLVRESVATTDRVEDGLHPWTSFVIVPVFALANAGIALGVGLHGPGARVALGVLLGLVVGKPVGVMLGSWLVVRLSGARLPGGTTWGQFMGIALLAGIGFTVSLFVTDLAFRTEATGAAFTGHAKVGILAASVLAALLGSSVLMVTGRHSPRADPCEDGEERDPARTARQAPTTSTPT